ncbi:MAG TPA: SCO family protein [Burkholderiales bacterium]
MLRTVLASAFFAALSYASAYALTHDFQVWTAEGARRLEVALNPVSPPAVALSAPWAPNQSLNRVLADGHAATIVDFVYTRCTTVCLSLGNTFQQLQTAIVSADPATVTPPVRLLSISFDPAHDDTRTLQQYAARLHADPRVWRFAGPRNAHDLAQLLKSYEVVVIPDGLGGFEHNAALLVVDPMGRLVRIFDYAEADLALAYARSIAAGSTAR